MSPRVRWEKAIGNCPWLSKLKGSDRQESTISLTQVDTTTTTTQGPIRQTYSGNADFPPMARAYKEVMHVVRETGLLRRTPIFYSLIGVALLLCFAGCVAGFILLGDSWFQLLIAGALGILFTQVAFLAHEAAHRQILSDGPANFRLARILAGPWAARSRGVIRWITKRQGWLFFPLLTLEGLNLHRLSFQHLFSRGTVKGRWTELSIITVRFALLLTPLFLFLPLGMAFAFFGVMVAVFGVYMGASFAPNHKGMPIIAPDARLDFFSKQVRTSRNVTGGWWATWMFGGLNYQVEHHLFPSMSRLNLSRAREIVKDYCSANDVPYTETTVLRSYGIVIQYLNRVGLAAGDPFDCPVAAPFGRA